ncbi:16S rRNA (uracil(1498)-N(3))-methyltransferase [Variovorax arabinosiphilus]|uniref:16S rRNA (uracil(1498)-N(3))-methyltransferase n=1 Tax=Variovorax arabinosiphilus TaxID=3053498 RepID=UPI002578328C|nr:MULTISPECIES: 16S rRNA (uracil(1498)-N(3))-methyltransferase [unclassified Variovorax]MDM0121545.1 16S rRNA (uracil(1498)-N(3))-methyltransferase [Variovorax sp. J2L1-78]MDM0130606.1 16S rRNA (uracil(1498)-N(3))-methyltransferase [Variovorax sp. J2L1-63]MDM0234308.1 16S rRNA (uracil(1498)-N(3))-methyltransferase [Variovorax sp. J2R1-6]
MPRFHCAVPLQAGLALALPPGAARHVQVLRMQPGEALTLFDGRGGEYAAVVERMGRSEVTVNVGAHDPVEREAPQAVHLALGMPANDRMDWLVEKATELGVASIQPLMTAHGVLRLAGERAEKKRAHWEAIAIAACEQCGRNRVPQLHPVRAYADWLGDAHTDDGVQRIVLSLVPGTQPLAALPAAGAWQVLSGPEGGLSADEEARALAQGFRPSRLGPRVLRAETAALAALTLLGGA